MTEDDGFNTVHPPMDGRSPSGRATAAEPVVSALRDGIPNAWQPIETAPKDGTAIDLWDRYGRRVNKKWAIHTWYNGKPIGAPCWGPYNGMEEGPLEPTHWMPLPPPPNQKAG